MKNQDKDGFRFAELQAKNYAIFGFESEMGSISLSLESAHVKIAG